MDAEVFDVFDLSDYTFYKLARGGVTGNTIVNSFNSNGVFKERRTLVVGDTTETKENNTTLHIRSTESFLAEVNNDCIGHGIYCQGKQYEVIEQTGGKNFDNGVMEHYTLTLQESEFLEESS